MAMYPCGTPFGENHQMCPVHGATWACEKVLKERRAAEDAKAEEELPPGQLAGSNSAEEESPTTLPPDAAPAAMRDMRKKGK